ncbi:hypothetical protein NC652_029131 [Populus alba x Populus x berolinensis]|nr:hypothetical protein NC652_029131 [Populus alba x Populus x berolinensis]
MLKCQKGASMVEVDVEMQKGASMLGNKELDRFIVYGYAVVWWLCWEMRIARGDGLRWGSVGFGFVEYRGIILLLQRKNSNLDLEEGRDRRRLKLSSLTGYGSIGSHAYG